MDDDKVRKTSDIVKALAHPARLRVLDALKKRPDTNVSDLQQHLQVDVGQLSNYLRMMADQQILSSRRKGTAVYYSIAIDDLPEAVAVFIARQ